MKEQRETDKKELDFFSIGKSFGGNQNWLKDKTMYYGGCAAVTASETMIYYGRQGKYVKNFFHKSKEDELTAVTEEQFISTTEKMKPYLRPRITGIHKLSTYVEGIHSFLEKHNETNLFAREFSGAHSNEDAKKVIETQIHAGHPIPYLLLLHKKPEFKHLTWHWFLIVGFKKMEEGFWIKVGTYGRARWYLLDSLWDTGYPQKGGMILFEDTKE